jgi:signal transduction histidine kinase
VNGVGFDPASVPPNHLGTKIMRERAEAIGAKYSLYSEPDEGTQISVTWEDPTPTLPRRAQNAR